MKNRFLILILAIIIFFVLPSLVFAESVSVKWVWDSGETLYQSNPTPITIHVKNISPKSINVTIIAVHMAWHDSDVFIIVFSGVKILNSGEEYNFSFVDIVSNKMERGETSDFACFVKGPTFDSGIIRASQVNIEKGKSIYSEETVDSLFVVIITILFSVFVVVVGIFRKRISKILSIHKNRLPMIVFVVAFIIFVLSVNANFGSWVASDPIIQGFAITGDEPHYVLLTRALLNGDLDLRNVYPEGKVIHGGISSGVFMKDTIVSNHGLMLPILSIIPYLLGMFFVGSGVYGILILNCVFASGIILLIYKIAMHLSDNVNVSLITAFTFAFSTLLFPWAGQVFPEIIIGFCLLLVSYKILVVPTKYDWILIGVIFGLIPFFRHQLFVLSLTALVLISTYLLKKRYSIKLKYFLSSFGIGLVLYIFYVVGFLGFEKLGFRLGALANPISPLSLAPSFNLFGIIPISQYFWLGLLGHWIDSNSGLLFYSPVLILAFLGIVPFIKKTKRFFVVFVFTIFGVWYLTTGMLSIWHGWLAIPARYMICILPLLSIPFVFALKEFRKKLLFKVSFVVLFLMGLISNGLIAFNRILGYTVVWVNGVPRSRYVIAMSQAFKLDFSILPDFAYAWFDGGEIGNVPQSPILLGTWAVIFLASAGSLLFVGMFREKIKEKILFSIKWRKKE